MVAELMPNGNTGDTTYTFTVDSTAGDWNSPSSIVWLGQPVEITREETKRKKLSAEEWLNSELQKALVPL